MYDWTRTLALGVVLVVAGAAAGCSSAPGPASVASDPTWIHQPTRTVEGGYIIYVGSGDDTMADRAQLKGESQAVEDIANECSFAPKGTRIEDRFLKREGAGYRAFVKMAIEFTDCEQAKRTNDPQEIKKLANARLTQQLADYQNLVYDGGEEDSASPGDLNAANPAGEVLAPRDHVQFFVLRQQVAYYKEVVILAPQTSYAPGSPQANLFVSRVAPATTRLQTYEAANPSIRSSPQAWSNLSSKPSVAAPAHLRPHSYLPRASGAGGARARQWANSRPRALPGPNKRGSGRKRRRGRNGQNPWENQ